MKEYANNSVGNAAKVNQFAVAANDVEPVFNKTAKINKSSDGVKKRVADLEWQIRFTQIHLNRWRALENSGWTSLETLQKSAKQELNSLVLQ
jgi:hypothetical protein